MRMRIGIVGWGEIAREHLSHFAPNGAELGGVVSRQPDLDLAVPVFRSLAEMLPHVDAITVAVPNHLHAPLCLQAVESGKPVLVEKPLCITRGELAELEESFQRLRVPVHLGYRLRRNPTTLKLKNRIANLRRIKCIYRLGIEQLADEKDWTRKLDITGGSFFTLGVHTLDLARWLADAGGRPLGNLKASATHRDDSADYPLNVWLSGTLPNGVEIVAGTDLRGNADSELVLEIDADEGGYPSSDLPPPVPADEPVEYAALIADFIRAVEVNEIDKNYNEEVLQTHRELLAARDLSQPV
jgi:predicted dehydrogenase